MFKDISHHIAKYAGAALVIAVGFGVFTVSVQGMGGKIAFNLPQLPILAESALAQVSSSGAGSSRPVTPSTVNAFVFTVEGLGPNQSGVTTLKSGDDVTLMSFSTRPNKQSIIEDASVLVTVDGANINQAVDSFKLFQVKNGKETLLSEVQAAKYRTNLAYITFEDIDTGMMDAGTVSYVVKADIISPKLVSSPKEFDVNDRLLVNLQSVGYRVSTSIVDQQFKFSGNIASSTKLVSQLISTEARRPHTDDVMGDQGEFVVKFKLTASGGDVHLPKSGFINDTMLSSTAKTVAKTVTIDGTESNDTKDSYVIRDGGSRVVTYMIRRAATVTTQEKATLNYVKWKTSGYEYHLSTDLNYSTNILNLIVSGTTTLMTIEPKTSDISVVLGDSYKQTFVSSGHTEASVWSISSGTLPAGLLLSSGAFSGVVSGKPTKVGEYYFTVRATDKANTTRYAESKVKITVKPQVLKIEPVSFMKSYKAGERVNQQFFGSSQHTIASWTVYEGKLPSGISLTKTGAFTASLVGTTTTKAGTFDFTIKATATDGSSALVPVSIIVTAPVATPSILPTFVSTSVTKAFVADGVGEQDIGEFKITFDVTARNGDVYLDRSVTRNRMTDGDGFVWATTSDSTVGTTSLSASVSAVNVSSSDTSYVYKVSNGETRRFTVSVDLDASDIDGYAAIKLIGINWTTDPNDTTPNTHHTANLREFVTDNLSLYTF